MTDGARGGMRFVLVSWLCLLSLPASLVAQENSKPPLEAWRVGGEVTAGMYAGYVGYFAGRFVGTQVGALVLPSNGREWPRTAIRQSFGYAVGGVATAGAVYGVGSIQNQTGDFGKTMAGTGIGFGAALVLHRVLWSPAKANESSGRRFARRTAEFAEVLLPAIGATIAFNSSRKRTN
jgi:hypothetical protein